MSRHRLPTARSIVAVAGLTLPLYIAFYLAPLLTNADDVRIAFAFSSDEANHVSVLSSLLAKHSMAVPFNSYGHLYFNIALIVLKALSFFSTIDDRTIILTLRALSASFSWLSVTALYTFAARFYDATVAAIAAFFFAVVPLDYVRFTIVSHPDTLQTLLIILAIGFLVEHFVADRRFALEASALTAGLAFAAKYSGILLLPLFLGTALVRARISAPFTSSGSSASIRTVRVLLFASGTIAVLLGTLVTPDVVYQCLHPAHPLSTSKLQMLRSLRHASVVAGIGSCAASCIAAPWRFLAETYDVPRLVRLLGKVALCFGLGFVLTSPYSLKSGAFIKGLIAESAHVAFGHSFRAPTGPWRWIPVLASNDLLGLGICLIAPFGILRAFVGIHERDDTRICARISAAWTCLVLFYLAFRVNYREPRYTFIVLPHLFLLSAAVLVSFSRWLHARANARFARAPGWGWLAAALTLALTWAPVTRAAAFRREVRGRSASDAVTVGKWLTDTVPPTVRIAYDPYAYVPAQFQNVQWSWEWTIDELASFGPDLVITTKEQRDSFADASLADQYVNGPERFQEIRNYYRMVSTSPAEFERLMQTDSISVFRRVPVTN